jgi:hypothetical protein
MAQAPDSRVSFNLAFPRYGLPNVPPTPETPRAFPQTDEATETDGDRLADPQAPAPGAPPIGSAPASEQATPAVPPNGAPTAPADPAPSAPIE